MLSIIYFSLIILIMISNTEQQQYSYTNSCLYFRGIRTETENMCTRLFMSVLLNDQAFDITCMKCEIETIDITINYNCTTDFDCALFWFPDNTMFESFFKQHRDTMKDRFPKNLQVLPQPALFIIVQDYNITEVTNDYINSTINIDLSNLTVVLKFIKRMQDVAPLTIKNDSLSIRFQSLAIQIQCENDTRRVVLYTTYRDTFNSTPLKINDCVQFPSTNQITTMTTTSFKTKTATLSSRNISSVSGISKSNKTAANQTTTAKLSEKKSKDKGNKLSPGKNTVKPPIAGITHIRFTTTTTTTTSTPLFTTASSTTSSTTMVEITFTSTVVSSTTTSTPLFTTSSTTMEITFISTVVSSTTTSAPFTLTTTTTTTSTFTTRSSTDMETTSTSTETSSTPFTSTTTILELTTELFETASITPATTTVTTVVEMATDKSFTSPHSSNIRKPLSSTSTLTIIITDPILATTEMTKTMQKTSSRTSIKTILSPIMTKTTSVAIPRSSIVPVKTENQPNPSSTSTKPSRKSSNTIIYIVFTSLLIIIVTIIVLISYLLYRYRKRRHLVSEDLNTISNMTNTDTDNNTNTDINRLNSSSNVSPSLLSKPYNETVSSKINFDHMFKDVTF